MKQVFWLIFMASLSSAASACDFYTMDLSGAAVRHAGGFGDEVKGGRVVTIIGHVERPGVYLFYGELSLWRLIDTAGVIAEREGLGSDLGRVDVLKVKQGKISEAMVVNIKYLIDSGAALASWPLEGGEVIRIPWMMKK